MGLQRLRTVSGVADIDSQRSSSVLCSARRGSWPLVPVMRKETVSRASSRSASHCCPPRISRIVHAGYTRFTRVW
nr:Uncharacterised protein [Klebsiella pneumoniae]